MHARGLSFHLLKARKFELGRQIISCKLKWFPNKYLEASRRFPAVLSSVWRKFRKFTFFLCLWARKAHGLFGKIHKNFNFEFVSSIGLKGVFVLLINVNSAIWKISTQMQNLSESNLWFALIIKTKLQEDCFWCHK